MASACGKVTMSHWYYATSQKPTAVTHAVVGELAGPGQYALVLGKTSRIEVHSITAEGLQPILDVPINGRIATLKTFRALVSDLPILNSLHYTDAQKRMRATRGLSAHLLFTRQCAPPPCSRTSAITSS